MAPQFFQATLAKKTQLTEDVFEFDFQLQKPDSIEFKAGQFVNIKVEDGNPKILFRSYSIMSSPQEKKMIATCIKVVQNGRCSTWLASLNVGTPLTLMGPIGVFKFNEEAKKKTIFVATGTGITPLRSMIVDQLEKGRTDQAIHLTWGFRFEKDIFYKNFFDELAKKYSNFSYNIVISRPEDSWTGDRGHVTDWLEKNIDEPTETQVYICGIGAMVTDVKNLCIAKGMDAGDVHFERYD